MTARRPLIISDCDEVLLHMVVPFGEWLSEAHGVEFAFETGDFVDALRHKACGTPVDQAKIWPLLKGFFETEMHRQQPIDGAVAALNTLSEHADIVILTNLTDDVRDARAAQLRKVGIDFPVFTNQGGKGDRLARIVAEHDPSLTIFVDDLPHQHASVAKSAPDTRRIHMVGEPRLAPYVKPADEAHVRIDDWASAEQWIMDIFEGNRR